MEIPHKLPVRKAHHLPIDLYSQHGAYFFTICTYNRKYTLGRIHDGEMIFSSLGRLVERAWQELPDHWPHLVLDVNVVMPNHFHGLLLY